MSSQEADEAKIEEMVRIGTKALIETLAKTFRDMKLLERRDENIKGTIGWCVVMVALEVLQADCGYRFTGVGEAIAKMAGRESTRKH